MDRVTFSRPVEINEYGQQLYPPGIVVPTGTYFREDRPGAPALELDQAGLLPALLDGHQVRYIRRAEAQAWP